MTYYRKMGKVPHKRHIVMRNEEGKLYREQVMGTKGFSGIQSILYHKNPPPQMAKSELIGSLELEYEEQGALRPRHIKTDNIKRGKDALSGRSYILGNDDLTIATVYPEKAMDYFYRNSDGDELLFVHYGTGKVETMFGTLRYEEGDYIYIPIGTIHRIIPDDDQTKLLITETASYITTPKRYRNEFGQFLEHSPFCERDFHGPEKLETHDEKGEFEVRTKARNYLHSHIYHHHPLDVVGWDGYLYPYTFNIADFEPITGRIHQPPPIHQHFEGFNFVVCSFVPRLYDYHPEAIPAPYDHSNVDSDEVLYYVEGQFMSRRGIDEGSVTLHPSGIPHGPHPGAVEASIGKKETFELAVMIDTFKPLKVVKGVKEDPSYETSWLEE